MARPLRIEFAGGLYHITARGNAQQDIYTDNHDRATFLELTDKTRTRFDWQVHAYCLMGNHYHLLIETGTPTLARGMKLLNGSYTQFFNRRHQRVGHLFQGRYRSILVDKKSYLLELARYIVLNPVRARMVRTAAHWEWSSYRATTGLAERPPLLTTDWILSSFADNRNQAQQRYRRFVQAGRNQPSPWEQINSQIYLGDDKFVEAMQCKLDPDQSLNDIPSKQKLAPPKPIEYFARKFSNRSEAMARAYLSRHYTLEEVGRAFGVSYATVSRAIKHHEKKREM
jgi:REP element-mobilizing transposase RayT